MNSHSYSPLFVKPAPRIVTLPPSDESVFSAAMPVIACEKLMTRGFETTVPLYTTSIHVEPSDAFQFRGSQTSRLSV